ncbi:MAG: GNAT family N-acetyltransferase [Brooklawnia sp.]|uniref:GNAT family N-acetyltransferase n=1 Tax=Brooklawnia sp. TaxID=2699740 RepID=UPI003C767B19
MYLEIERLVLRQFTPDDVAALVALDADPAVMRFITNGVPTPPDEIADEHVAPGDGEGGPAIRPVVPR